MGSSALQYLAYGSLSLLNTPDRDYFVIKKSFEAKKRPKTGVFYSQSACGFPAIYAL
jgi:hypothetical protein